MSGEMRMGMGMGARAGHQAGQLAGLDWVDMDTPQGWEGEVVARASYPMEPFATVVCDDGSSKIEIQPWDYEKYKLPTKTVKRDTLVIWRPQRG